MLLQHGATTEAKDRFGRTALFPASLRAYIGVDIRSRKKPFLDKRVKTIDEIKKEEADMAEEKSARRREYLEVVKLLLAARANVDAKDKDDRTPLIHLAAERGESFEQDVVELLIQYGANIEEKDRTEQRRNALHWAAVTGKVEFAKVLLEENFAATGANVNGMLNASTLLREVLTRKQPQRIAIADRCTLQPNKATTP
jgi:Ankyrin repeats (3 copies)